MVYKNRKGTASHLKKEIAPTLTLLRTRQGLSYESNKKKVVQEKCIKK